MDPVDPMVYSPAAAATELLSCAPFVANNLEVMEIPMAQWASCQRLRK